MRNQPLIVIMLEILGIVALVLWILAELGHRVTF